MAERLAVTLEDADRAIAATKAAGVPLQVGFNRRFDIGALATAEASFNAVYGYDIRGEVLARPAWPPPATSAATPRSTTATTA